MRNPFFTIGHSNRPLDVFVAMLRAADIRLVVDVRTIPRSRSNSQYNGAVLAASLSAFQIGYEHVAALGGLRERQSNVPQATNAFWQNQRFHNYADYAMSADFHGGLSVLSNLGDIERCAIMCAEALWWRCHRRIISDYLLATGEMVFHILGPNQVKQAYITSGATVGGNGMVTYPADVTYVR